MKYFITLLFVFNTLILIAQPIKFNIQGEIKNTAHAKFAYLTTLSQQTTISSPKIFIVSPIINGEFSFKGTFNLEQNDYQQACVFVDERSNISKEEIASKFKELIWVTGREGNLRMIVLEDLTLKIEGQDQMKVSEITAGGKLTKQLDELHLAFVKGDKEFLVFIKKYPDSPISFDGVKSLTNMAQASNKDKIESRWGSPVEQYELLSNRLKKSGKGIILKKQIDEKYKN
ncbi:hypothetical protein [Pedobacter sp. L105]|uniref:hypothetical protein n=1 Tax=Pedobacter sp. L105 TaxID=1641871 RepID=UPI00131BD62C|nr:hypothetical protein [Pedobacter sp. L105]